MRNLKSIIVIIFILIVSKVDLMYSQNYYYSDNCGGTPVNVTANCPSYSSFDIEVSGESIMGLDNYGIIEAYFDIDQNIGFLSTVTLVSPSGDVFLLASGEEGILSFPDMVPPVLYVGFRDCESLPYHNQILGADPNNNNFRPFENFTTLNNGTNDPNGTWQMRFCGLPDDLTVYCARIAFGQICPEVTSVNITPASCPTSNDGSVEINAVEGNCGGILYSLDDVNYQSSPIFNGLTAGDYTVHVGDSYITSFVSDIVNCETTFDFTILANDNINPIIPDCPSNMTIQLDENCSGSFNLTDISATDNCNIDSSSVTITDNDGIIITYSLSPGTSFPYNYNGVGNITFDWYVEDDSGNTATCQTVITLEDNIDPVWINQFVQLQAECGVDDPNQMALVNLINLTGSDNCTEVFLTDVVPGGTPTCGGTIAYEFYYTLNDMNGNDNSSNGIIYIDEVDTQAPIISGMSQGNETISCNEPLPITPVLGVSVFANDVCEGDVTDSVILTSSSVFGDCNLGEPIEIITYTYSVTDGCGNNASVSYAVTIIDDVAPVWDEPFDAPVVLNAVCGEDDITNLINNNVPSASGCSGSATVSLESNLFTATCTGSSNVGTTVLTYRAEDDCGNEAFTTLTIIFVDDTAPTINGLPNNVLINCNDAYPSIPSPTALDGCEGDVTSLMSMSISTVQGSCDFNATALVDTYTWTAIDYCGNSIEASWTVTVVNDAQVDLGDDIVICGSGSATIQPSGFSGTYEWSDGSSGDQLVVNNAGTYSVVATSANGCCSTDEIIVTFEDIPNASAMGGTLDCNGTAITIMGNSTTSNVTYAWSGPGGFSSTIQNPAVNQPGTYTLMVSTQNGCTNTATTEVLSDVNVPNITTSGNSINCNNNTVTILGSSTTANVTYAWTGPNGFTTTMSNPSVSEPGDYNLTITAPNGCIAMGLAVVTEDFSLPQATLENAIIDCNTTTVTLMPNPINNDFDYAWAGPNGFTSNTAIIDVSNPGSYTLMITGTNGCSISLMANVEEDGDFPITQEIVVADVDCQNKILTIGPDESLNTYSFNWTLNGQNISVGENININEAGNYSLEVTAPNGCASTYNYNLIQNFDPITADIATVNASASANGSASIIIITPTQIQSVLWDNGDEGLNASELLVGDHTVTVTDLLGCTQVFNFEILMSSSVSQIPNVSELAVYPNLTSDFVNCIVTFKNSTSINIIIQSIDGHRIFTKQYEDQININDRIDLSNYSEGLYFLTLQTKEGAQTVKIVKTN